MRPSLSWIFPLLLVFALITAVPAGQAGNGPLEPLLLPVEAAATVPTSGQVSTAGAGAETIVLAAARSLPTGTETPRPKKARKAKGPAEGSGCEGGKLQAGTGEDIVIDSSCTVGAGTYHYGFVNIVNGGTLNFEDQSIDFWAKSILVENEGSLIVGSFHKPIGNTVTFHLYGAENETPGAAGITCKTTAPDGTKICGVPKEKWSKWGQWMRLPSGVSDYFYAYLTLPGDDIDYNNGKNKRLSGDSYFGLKTLAVSFGGTLQMFGKKGAESHDPNPHDDDFSGESWVRLNKSVAANGTELVLDRKVDTWEEGDWIVVTATDYIPNHSEMRRIDSVGTDGDHSVITLKTALDYPHNGEKYDLTKHNIPDRLNIDKEKNYMEGVDTRAAVALLTRSIRIVSEGAAFNQPLPSPNDSSSGRYFGGHVIARQGFKTFQMRGVELKQLGQGGRMTHSPVNFHMARKLPAEGQPNSAFVVACSVNESMTRMYEIRGTQGAILKSNVGYKSIGHGYFLAEGTETGNILKANLGIYARPAVDYRDNPRKVPGILSAFSWQSNLGKFATDVVHPSVFYIGNGYNTFEDNMAVGAGTCGACYWIAPVGIGGLSKHKSWEKYAGIQQKTHGAAPLKRFHGNSCSTAMFSLITIDSPGSCDGVHNPVPPGFPPPEKTMLYPIITPFEAAYFQPNPGDPDNALDLYPNIKTGDVLNATICPDNATDCTDVTPACDKGRTEHCAVNVIDSYTSSFHWAPQNYSAIWLRTNWFLFTNSALTDVLNGGLTMVSGGDWEQVKNRYWALTRKSVFIGQTQDDKQNIYAQNQGPVNHDTMGKLACLKMVGGRNSFCRVQDGEGKDEGILIPRENFAVYQRLYNIYDGPVYQEANAFLNIKKRQVFGCDNNTGQCLDNTNFLYHLSPGIPKATEHPLKGECILPNAAIGWKQPNGFYYPPAFHSKNLFFDGVDIRHFVIVPLFKPGTLEVDVDAVTKAYCTYPPGAPATLFADSWTDIDRQTELNDDDGSLSGLGGTVSVNKDQFYYAPKSPFECLSEQSCYQSPYDYVSAVVLPSGRPDNWDMRANSRTCYGVPIYRQYLNDEEKVGEQQGIRMLGAELYQRSTMIANKGKYYIDTAVSASKQQSAAFRNEFKANQKYNFFLIYAKPTTRVTFQMYVGDNNTVTFDAETDLEMVRVGIKRDDPAKVLVEHDSAQFITPDVWPKGWSRTYKPSTGILEVTMDLTLTKFETDFKESEADSCGPPSFCEWKGDRCGCADYPDSKKNPLMFPCEDSICEWSSLRSECPKNGCFGFQVKFPPGFVADDSTMPGSNVSYKPLHRPDPEPSFPLDWHVTWQKASQDLSWDDSFSKSILPSEYPDDVYPQGPCCYNTDGKHPQNAPLPSAK